MLLALAQGLGTRGAASSVHMAPTSTRNALSLLYVKMGARNAPHAVALAIVRGELAATDVEAAPPSPAVPR